MDYTKKGEEELTLAKDDSLRVFKRYNHWSYVSGPTDSSGSCVPDQVCHRLSKRRLATVVGFR